MKDIEFTSNLILSHFNETIGPELLYSIGEETTSEIRKIIPNLIDITHGKLLDIKPFIFANSMFQAQNIIFSINSENYRGKTKEFLLSFCIQPSSQLGFIAIMGLESFFMSCSKEFTSILEKLQISDTEEIRKSNGFEIIKEQMEIYYNEILSFVNRILEKN